MSANYLYIDAALTELKTLSDTLNSSFIVNGSNDNVCRTDYYGYDFLYTRVLMNLRNTPAQSVYIYNKDFLYYFLTCIVPIGCDIDEMLRSCGLTSAVITVMVLINNTLNYRIRHNFINAL